MSDDFSQTVLNALYCSGAARCCGCEGRCSGGLCDTNREREEYQRAERSQVSVTTVDLVFRDTESVNSFSHALVLMLFSKSTIVLVIYWRSCRDIHCYFNWRFKVNLHQCLIQISGYNTLFMTVEELRKVTFDSESEEHEKMLLKVCDFWDSYCPSVRFITMNFPSLSIAMQDFSDRAAARAGRYDRNIISQYSRAFLWYVMCITIYNLVNKPEVKQ